MLNKKTIRDISVSSKKVLVRCDFNVPLDKDNPDIKGADKIAEALHVSLTIKDPGIKEI